MTSRFLPFVFAVGLAQSALAQNATLLTTFTSPNPADDDFFGYSVAAVGNDRVLIGAWNDDTGTQDAGMVYLFSANGELLTTFTNATLASGDRFGYSVAAMGSDRVLIGAVRDDTGAADAGAVYVFDTNGTLLTTITNPIPVTGDNFGFSVAAMGSDRVLVGAPGEPFSIPPPVTAYLFSTDGTLLSTFDNPTPESGDSFGGSVAPIGSDLVLIGAPGALNAGSAYLFSTNGLLLTTFTNPAPVIHGGFAVSVGALGSDRLLVGAIQNRAGTVASGAAYLYNTNGTLLTTFNSPTPASFERFGNSVAAVGNNQVLIGAVGGSTGAAQAGAAYLFSTNGTLMTTFNKPTPVAHEFFGWLVTAMGSDRVLIGAYGAHITSVERGAVYLFALPPTLTILPSISGNTTISWTPETTGFVLQETESLSPVNWTNSPSGAANPAGASTTKPAKFFRLIKP